MKTNRPALSRLARAASFCVAAWEPLAQAQTVVNGTAFGTPGLVGVGRLAAELRGRHGETFGSISGLVADLSRWTRSGNSHSGVFCA
jgi:hypothetical protein